MAPNLAAFEHALKAQTWACGAPLLATVGAVSDKDALVSVLTKDEVFVAGGKADSGGFTLQMRVSDFADAPEPLQSATARGQTLSVLSFTEASGIYTITCGDPSAEVRD